MELRQLKTFQCVAECGSLGRAADRLHIAQPALSRQIKQLERELHTILFIRNGRGMVLTDAGELLLSRVGGLVRQINQVADDISSMGGSPSGTVALGIVPTVSCVIAAKLAARAASETPKVSLRIIESYGGHLVDWLHRGEIDAAIIYGHEEGSHLDQEPLCTDDLMIIGPKGTTLARDSRGSLTWLAAQPLVLPSKSHGLRQQIDRVTQRKRLRLNTVTEADSFRVLIDMVALGLGYTILPASAVAREIQRGELEAVPIREPRMVRKVVLARSKSSAASLAVQAISALIRREVQMVAKSGLWRVPMETANTPQSLPVRRDPTPLFSR